MMDLSPLVHRRLKKAAAIHPLPRGGRDSGSLRLRVRVEVGCRKGYEGKGDGNSDVCATVVTNPPKIIAVRDPPPGPSPCPDEPTAFSPFALGLLQRLVVGDLQLQRVHSCARALTPLFDLGVWAHLEPEALVETPVRG